MQVLAGHCNLQRHKKTTSCAKSSLCPKCSLEDEAPNQYVGNCKLYQYAYLYLPHICVKYFGITKTTVHDVVTKCNINTTATYLKEAGRLSEFDQCFIRINKEKKKTTTQVKTCIFVDSFAKGDCLLQ